MFYKNLLDKKTSKAAKYSIKMLFFNTNLSISVNN